MASRTQIRLQQLTGSLVNLKTEAQQYVTPKAAASLTGSDLQDVLGAFGAALNRIHGAASDEPFNATAGHFLNSATTDGADDAGAIKLSAANGGIGIAFNDAKDLWIEGGQTMVVANHDTADAIKLHADAGSSQTITVLNDEGTAAAAIALTATAGGVDIDAAAGKDVAINGGQVILTGLDDSASSISLVTDNGTSETITVQALSSEADGAITLQSPSGGILLDTNASGKKIHLDSEGSVDIDAVKGITISNASAANGDDITIEQTGGTNSSLHLASSGTEADALTISTSAGGMDITVAGAAAGEDLDITANSSVNITSSENIADSIVISGGGGVDIVTQNDKDLDITSANKINIDAQGTDSGDGVIITLGSDTTDTAFKILNNSGQDAFVVNGGKNAQLEGNLTVNGNLDINGTTTTIDTTNFQVEDSIIALGISGSGTFNNLGDRGILFAKGAAAHSLMPALFLKSSVFELGNTATSPTSGSFTTIAEGNHGTLRLGTVQFSSADDKMGIDPASGILEITGSSGLKLLGATANLEIRNTGANDIIFKNGTNTLFTLDNGFAHSMVGSLAIGGNGGSAAGSLILNDNDDSNSVTIKSPATIGSDFDIVLPASNGSGLEVLRLNSGGTALEFADISAAGTTSKQVLLLDTAIAADNALSTNSGAATSDVTYSGDDITDMSVIGTQGKVLDVFVNGQLLTSGSNAEITANPPTADYQVSAAAALKFAFALEIDDVVQVIKRG